jgi:hypothetical protein
MSSAYGEPVGGVIHAPTPIGGPSSDGTVDRRERLGGILNYYYRRAA